MDNVNIASPPAPEPNKTDGKTIDVGDVLSTSVQVITKNLPAFLVISLVFMSPSVIFSLATEFLKRSGSFSGFMMGMLLTISGSVVAMILYRLAEGVIIYGAVEYLAGREQPFGVVMQRGLRRMVIRLVPLIVTALLTSFATGFGLLFCIVPGVILMVMFSVVAPIVVIEDIGPIEAIKRSIELTEGNRVQIFLCMLVYVAIGAVGGIAAAIVAAVAGYSAAQGSASMIPIIISVLMSGLFATAQTMVASVVDTVIYARLARVKSGVDVDAIARVFS